MARPRTPTNILEARGAFGKNPNRKRIDPEVKPLGRVPAHLNEKLRKIWHELVKILPDGVAGAADRIALETMCVLIHEQRTKPDSMTDGRRSLLRQYLGQFGMTPADRAKISTPPPPPKNDFDDL